MAGTSTTVLAEVAALAADGRMQVPIAAAYPLTQVAPGPLSRCCRAPWLSARITQHA